MTVLTILDGAVDVETYMSALLWKRNLHVCLVVDILDDLVLLVSNRTIVVQHALHAFYKYLLQLLQPRTHVATGERLGLRSLVI